MSSRNRIFFTDLVEVEVNSLIGRVLARPEEREKYINRMAADIRRSFLNIVGEGFEIVDEEGLFFDLEKKRGIELITLAIREKINDYQKRRKSYSEDKEISAVHTGEVTAVGRNDIVVSVPGVGSYNVRVRGVDYDFKPGTLILLKLSDQSSTKTPKAAFAGFPPNLTAAE